MEVPLKPKLSKVRDLTLWVWLRHRCAPVLTISTGLLLLGRDVEKIPSPARPTDLT